MNEQKLEFISHQIDKIDQKENYSDESENEYYYEEDD